MSLPYYIINNEGVLLQVIPLLHDTNNNDYCEVQGCLVVVDEVDGEEVKVFSVEPSKEGL